MSNMLMQAIGECLQKRTIALPISQQVVSEIGTALKNKNEIVSKAAELLSKDQALAVRTLSLANNPYAEGLKEVVSIRAAIQDMGPDPVFDLLVAAANHVSYVPPSQAAAMKQTQLWQHALGCAIGCEWLAKQTHFFEEDLDEAFTAGLLHDIGKLFLMKAFDAVQSKLPAQTRLSGAAVEDMIEHMHSSIGAEFLRQQNIPNVYCEAAMHHENPSDSADPIVRLVAIVNRSCNEIGLGLNKKQHSKPTTFAGVTDLLLARLEILLEDLREERFQVE